MANRSVLRAAIRLCNAADEPTRQADNFFRARSFDRMPRERRDAET